jgi:hypothetical protein
MKLSLCRSEANFVRGIKERAPKNEAKTNPIKGKFKPDRGRFRAD